MSCPGSGSGCGSCFIGVQFAQELLGVAWGIAGSVLTMRVRGDGFGLAFPAGCSCWWVLRLGLRGCLLLWLDAPLYALRVPPSSTARTRSANFSVPEVIAKSVSKERKGAGYERGGRGRT